jgi:hypothetical protein
MDLPAGEERFPPQDANHGASTDYGASFSGFLVFFFFHSCRPACARESDASLMSFLFSFSVYPDSEGTFLNRLISNFRPTLGRSLSSPLLPPHSPVPVSLAASSQGWPATTPPAIPSPRERRPSIESIDDVPATASTKDSSRLGLRDGDGRQSLRTKLRPLFRRTASGQRFLPGSQSSVPPSPDESIRRLAGASSVKSPALTPDASRTPVGDKTPVLNASPPQAGTHSSYFPYISPSGFVDLIVPPISEVLAQLVPAPLALLTATEQLSSTCLSLPAASVGALWRCMHCIDWLGKHYPFSSQRPESSLDTFDIIGLVQACGDILAATAADAGIELVPEEEALKEVIVQGDKTGWLVALVTVSCPFFVFRDYAFSDLLYVCRSCGRPWPKHDRVPAFKSLSPSCLLPWRTKRSTRGSAKSTSRFPLRVILTNDLDALLLTLSWPPLLFDIFAST